MTRGYSTPCARELGYEMRLRRQRIGLNAVDLSRIVGWSESKISRAELGMYRVSEVEVVHYLAACGVPHDELNELLELKRDEERNLGHWMRPHDTGNLSNSMRTLIYHETTASRSTSYEPEVVPGLLQTEDYAAALLRGEGAPDEVFSTHLRARMDRKAALYRPDPSEFVFFIHEQALRLPVAESAIMHEQLLSLVFATSQQHIDIRVVPTNAGAQAVCRGSFRLFEYTKEHRPVVYLEGWVGAIFLDDDAFIASYRQLVPKLASAALNEGQSREFLAALASDHDRAKGTLDAQLEEEQLQ
jgi:uncharacterized protein DUF5753/helix-turn-helix protein